MQLTATFRSLLPLFRDVFTAPTFATFVTLATGWCLSPRHRYIREFPDNNLTLFRDSCSPLSEAS